MIYGNLDFIGNDSLNRKPGLLKALKSLFLVDCIVVSVSFPIGGDLSSNNIGGSIMLLHDFADLLLFTSFSQLMELIEFLKSFVIFFLIIHVVDEGFDVIV